MNLVILNGHLGADPDVRFTQEGAQVTTFRMATNEVYKDKDGNKKTVTDWHRVVCWRGLAETAGNYLKKGREVTITGKIKTRSFKDSKTGEDRYITEIRATTLKFNGKKPDAPADTAEPAGELHDEEVPF